MKRILLVGAGHAHLAVLRSLKEEPLEGARFALVAPQPKQLYSGMLPGLIAGHYRRDEAEIDVARLADAAAAEFIAGEVAKLDSAQKVARLAEGAELEYDIVSINVGSLVERSIPGAQFALPVKIVGTETVRAPDGLAMSSRNGYLGADERAEAPNLYRVLRGLVGELRKARADGSLDAPLLARLESAAGDELKARGWQPDYVTVRRRRDLLPPDAAQLQGTEPLVALAAARIGKPRLLDNIEL